MGDPRKIRSKFAGPSHPWQRQRIVEEKQLVKEYGLKNKTEIWKMTSMLKSVARQAKNLIPLATVQAEREKKQLMTRLQRYGLVPMNTNMDAVLGLTLRDLLERRLQTQVYKKNLAHTMRQARQFITHGHITIAGRKISSPSYLVPITEETQISFMINSTLANTEHPERQIAPASESKKKLKKKTREERGPRRGGRAPRREKRMEKKQ
ncbi:30S ribosomal protein S4 [Candidatus Woesearchaeota archaeon]|nr:30S ribosomal protein S4 [Candidatus Woesearchaeota archaeon]